MVTLVVFTTCAPKATEVGLSVVGAAPVPVIVTVCPVLLASSFMERMPEGRTPIAVGVNVRARLQLAPAANGTAIEQVLDGSRANSLPPDNANELKVSGLVT